MQTFVIPMVKGNILNKTERILKPRNYSPMTHKAYLFYIEEQINFSKWYSLGLCSEFRLRNKTPTVLSGNAGFFGSNFTSLAFIIYFWVPDTARYTRSSGTTKRIMFSSQFRDDRRRGVWLRVRDDRRNNVQFAVPGRQCFFVISILLMYLSSLLFKYVILKPQVFLFCHLETSSLFILSSRKAEQGEVYPGSRS